MKRRTLVKSALLGASLGVLSSCKELSNNGNKEEALNGNVNHSACRWCYPDIPLEQLAEHAVDIGLKSIELLDPDEWDIVLNKGISCAISNGSPLGITKGFNNPLLHDELFNDFESIIPRAAEKGIQQIICFSGNRNGLTDSDGIENCALGLDRVVKLAERYNIRIVMELLNSKVDHFDYQCDHTAWGTQLVEKIGSPNFKLLYDIYHMQIMEGDVISTITNNQKYLAHFHTGGVPGRNEINETQELNYKAIVRAIVESGFDGYIAQEFIPSRKDPIESLKEGVNICDV